MKRTGGWRAMKGRSGLLRPWIPSSTLSRQNHRASKSRRNSERPVRIISLNKISNRSREEKKKGERCSIFTTDNNFRRTPQNYILQRNETTICTISDGFIVCTRGGGTANGIIIADQTERGERRKKKVWGKGKGDLDLQMLRGGAWMRGIRMCVFSRFTRVSSTPRSSKGGTLTADRCERGGSSRDQNLVAS